MKQPTVDWPNAVKPLIKKYKDHKHPLDAKNLYQMLVMVVLSAQTTDTVINLIAPELFKAMPTMEALAKCEPEDLHKYISKVRSFGNKSKWLVAIAKQLKKDSAIPTTMGGLVALPGIGRKSANVIKNYAKAEIEGIVVDLHTIRVSNRLGIVDTEDPKKIEQEMMELLPQKQWDAGMCMSFLGREVCRPTNPDHAKCVMNKVCAYYQSTQN
ncbi:endonuclease III [Panacibacter ginsenosidivorans]|uniref:Endonuclease III n=1 Tax=Panacibacter ginsenosidivorans TaxID=1813871 RepID=A0A5B8VFM7_9BACT|nr:endonuclease III [Panacibacter ginsenosidivorans]QEC69346.1 endonuclease III [Panacibacter ginsenosidivorans]